MSFAFFLFHFALLISLIPCRAATVSRAVVDFLPYATIGRMINMHKSSLGPNVLNDNLNQQSSFQTVDDYTSESSYKFISTTSEATRVINKNGDFALRTALGLSPIGGSVSGNYFKSSLNRESFAELLFNINVKTHTRSLANYRAAINTTRCSQVATKGTHIVTGIQYGASCIISLRTQAETVYEKETATGNVKAMFGISMVNINAAGSLSELSEQVKKMTNVTVYTFCNLHLDSFPSTPVEGIKLVESFLKRMYEENKGGVPIQMELTHISEFAQCNAKGALPWQDSKSLTAFFDQTTELLEDVTVAYKRLWTCSEILTASSDAAAEAAKAEAKVLREQMKKVNYELRKFIGQIDPAKGPDQFDQLATIYGAGASAVNLYDHNHWRVKVYKTCQKLKNLPRMLPPIHKAVSPNCIYDPQIAHRAGTTMNGRIYTKLDDVIDGDANTFQQFPDNWFVSLLMLKPGVRRVISIEILFDLELPPRSGMKMDIYLTNKQLMAGILISSERKSEYGFKHSGTITIPNLHRTSYLAVEKLRSIKVEMEKDTDAQKLMRLEGKEGIRISEIRVAGERCIS